MSLIPEHLKYTETHEWLEQDQDCVRIGITDHAQQLLGDLVFVDLPDVGQEVIAGDELGILESVKAASDYYAPVSGVVVEVNQAVADNPALLNQDPYGNAWLVKLSVHDSADVAQMMSADEYSDILAEDD